MLHLFSNKNAFFYVMDSYPAGFHVNHVPLWCVENYSGLVSLGVPTGACGILKGGGIGDVVSSWEIFGVARSHVHQGT